MKKHYVGMAVNIFHMVTMEEAEELCREIVESIADKYPMDEPGASVEVEILETAP